MAYTELLDAAIRRTREESDRTRASASGTVCVAISQILSVWCEGSDGYGKGGAALSLRCRVYDSEGSAELLEGKTLLRVALGKTPEPSSFPFVFLLSFSGLVVVDFAHAHATVDSLGCGDEGSEAASLMMFLASSRTIA